MALPSRSDTQVAPSPSPARLQKPWYLREVPRPVAVAAVSPLVLIAVVAILVLLAVVTSALAILLVAPGLGFVYLLFPNSAFLTRPAHLALAAVLGALIWSVTFLAASPVIRWFALSAAPKRLRPRPGNAA